MDFVKTITDDLVREIGPLVRSRVENDSRKAILSSDASAILTFVTPDGTRYSPAATPSYAKALWCFVRDKDLDGISLDSSITDPVVKAVESAVMAELNSPQARDAIIRSIAPGASISSEVKLALDEEAKWVGREFMAAAGISPAALVTAKLAAVGADNASDILGTAAGKTVLAGVAQLAMTSSGQMLLAKMVSLSAAKLAGTTILKASVAASLKKIGVVFLVKMVLVKLLGAAFPALMAAHIPLFWIFLPIIGAFIYHEMKSMPRKLAETLPPKVASEVEANFPTVARSFAQMILADTVREVSVAAAAE